MTPDEDVTTLCWELWIVSPPGRGGESPSRNAVVAGLGSSDSEGRDGLRSSGIDAGVAEVLAG